MSEVKINTLSRTLENTVEQGKVCSNGMKVYRFLMKAVNWKQPVQFSRWFSLLKARDTQLYFITSHVVCSVL
jgi:hypothetical protein